jgi:hypothetical protein
MDPLGDNIQRLAEREELPKEPKRGTENCVKNQQKVVS